MPQPRAADTRRALALLLPYPVLSATVDVYAARSEQRMDPAVVAAVAFTLTAVLFAGPQAAVRRLGPRRAALGPPGSLFFEQLALVRSLHRETRR